MIHFTHRSGGPCWSRDRGYHTPAPLPMFLAYMAMTPRGKPISDELRAFVGTPTQQEDR